MSQVIYARVPDTLKEAVDVYATERGTTLTSAVVDLLEHGLLATPDAPSVGDLEQKLATLAAEKSLAEASLKSARIELETIQLLAKRADQTVGSCPRADCARPISGQDLLVAGRCSACDAPLNQLLKLKSPQPEGDSGQTRPGGLSERDFLLLLGALGVVVGAAAYAASKS